MHPARSVIAFTTASGAGYGLLVLVSVLFVLGAVPDDGNLGWLGLGLALGLIGGGLLMSTFHLGHPERAVKAVRQWRTSWLAREGVAALVTFVPAGLLFLVWGVLGETGGLATAAALAAAALACITIVCTSMIYASLRAVPLWTSPLVPLGYLLLGLATGGLLLGLVTRALGVWQPVIAWVTLAGLAAAWAVKIAYWRRARTVADPSTPETATGVGHLGAVKLLEAPHTERNFVEREMGAVTDRGQILRRRRHVHLFLFLLPVFLVGLSLGTGETGALVATALAVASAGVGVVAERWLFFAEAQHRAMLYYRRG